MQETATVPFMLLGMLFNICLVASNLLETKVVQVGGIATTAGLIVFPTSYIIDDCITEVWGFKKARLIIWSGFASNSLVVIFTQLAVLLLVTPFWEGEEGFNLVFGTAPHMTVTSLAALLTGSFLNAYVMGKMKITSNRKSLSLQTIVSILISEGVDSTIFFPITFAGLTPAGELLTTIRTWTVLEFLYEVIILPAVIRIVKYIKRVDGSGVYDPGTSYNILKVKDI